MLKLRLLTALWGIPLIAAAIWFGEPWFTIAIIVSGLLGAIEFFRISSDQHPLSFLGTVWILLFIVSPHFDYTKAVPLLLTSAVVFSLIWVIFRSRTGNRFSGWTWTMAGILYLGWLLSNLVALRGMEDGRGWVFLALFGTFASDSAAFFVGSYWGKHKMAPSISPRKTWEGAIAGLAGTAIASLILVSFFRLPLDLWLAVLVGLGISIFGQLGDLAESLIKRSMGTKESGNVLPGHGGMLDRLDSILFVSAFVYYLVLFIK